MLGTGLSKKSQDQNVTVSVQSDLLKALIGHWCVERPQVIGHDFGGLCALRGHFVNGIAYSKLHLVNAVAVLPSDSPFYTHVANMSPLLLACQPMTTKRFSEPAFKPRPIIHCAKR